MVEEVFFGYIWQNIVSYGLGKMGETRLSACSSLK